MQTQIAAAGARVFTACLFSFVAMMAFASLVNV